MTKENTLKLYKNLKAQGHPNAERMANQKGYEWLKEEDKPKELEGENGKKSKRRTK